MRLRAIHTCPIWQEADGTRRPGISFEAEHPPVVGWCNVAELDFDGERVMLLLTI